MSSPNIEYYEQLAGVYELFFDDLAESMAAEGRWLDAILAPRGVRRVLDASCGTGRQALPLAGLGYDVVAADPSEAMLDVAGRAANEAGLALRLLRASFTELPDHFGADFDAVIAMGNSLSHAGSCTEILEALRALSRCVAAGGVCVVGIKDFAQLSAQRRRFHPHRVVDGPEGRAVLFEIWDYHDPLLDVTTFLLRSDPSGWSVRTAMAQEYMLGAVELADMAGKAGFDSCYRVPHPCEATYILGK